MSGSTNFQQWNPGQVNQETDAQYLSDSQRSGGAPNSTPAPSVTLNKLFYQVSTGITALMQMMSAKGFVVNDTNIGTLASVLAAIQTTADLKNNLQVQSFSSTMNFDASKFNGLQVTLTGNPTINITGQTAGQLITLCFIQDSAGGRTVNVPGFIGWPGASLDTTPNTISVLIGMVKNDLTIATITPIISSHGIIGTPIGQSNPQPGTFTTLNASSASVTSLTTGSLSVTNMTASGTVQAAKVLASESASTSGGFSFTQDGAQDTGMFSPSDGVIRIYSNGVSIMEFQPSQIIFGALAVNFLGGSTTLAGGALNGSYAGDTVFNGNPTFNGSTATNIVTTNTPSNPNDSSGRVPNTFWVNNFVVNYVTSAISAATSSILSTVSGMISSAISGLISGAGFSASFGSSGFIRFPDSLANFTIQWTAGSPVFGNSAQGISFPISFPNSCFRVFTTNFSSGGDIGEMGMWQVTGYNQSSCSVYFTRNSDHGGNSNTPMIFAIGY